MNIRAADLTRQAAGAALMLRHARMKVLHSYLADPLHAVPPELGLDTELVARVALFSQRREAAYGLVCIAVAVVAAGVHFLVESSPGWSVLVSSMSAYALAGVVLHAYWDRDRFTRLLPLFWNERFSSAAVADTMPVDLPKHFADACVAPMNVVVFRNGGRAFVGAGHELGTWEISIDLRKGADRDGKRLTPKQLVLDELYAEVARALISKGPTGLSASDWFFVDGNSARQDQRIVPSQKERPLRFVETSKCVLGSA